MGSDYILDCTFPRSTPLYSLQDHLHVLHHISKQLHYVNLGDDIVPPNNCVHLGDGIVPLLHKAALTLTSNINPLESSGALVHLYSGLVVKHKRTGAW